MPRDSKITPSHLQRNAYIYIRQSTDHQVRENIESQQRQYELVDIARQHHWADDSIVVIDDDLGRSASSTTGRNGFAKLVSDVALGKAGIIFGLEVSRLARNNRDWYQLLDLCSISGTLIADADGIYDPSSFNDRLLLGLKGTMSEAELHMLKNRMLQGLYHKAQKGELRFNLPAGYQFDQEGNIIKSLDEQVVHFIELVFKTFNEIGTVNGVTTSLVEQNLFFPRKASFEKKLRWVRPYVKAVHDTLINPLYAGTYVFGRTKVVKELDENGNSRSRQITQPMEEWDVIIHDHHPAYISWEEYLSIREQMRKNAPVPKTQASSVPREGSALLQGLARCGKCGRSMHVNYHGQGAVSYPYYICNMAHRNFVQSYCQSIGGRRIDHFVAQKFLEAVSPASLNIHLRALKLIRDQEETALKQHRLQLERAQYEAHRIFRQFDSVEPENRLVARTLERQWNESLKQVDDIQAYINEKRKSYEHQLSTIEEQNLKNLARDLPILWSTASDRDRKRLLRAAIKEVQLLKEHRDVSLKILWVGGALTQHTVHLPKVRSKRATPLDEVEIIRQLAQRFSDDQIARILIRQGRKTPTGLNYNAHKVANVRRTYEIPRYRKPQEQLKSYTAEQAAKILNVSTPTIHNWLNSGFIKGQQLTEGAPWEIFLTEKDINRLTAHETPEGWLSLQHAAKELGVSKQTVLNWVKSEKLEYIYVTKGKKKGLRINPNSSSYRKQIPIFA
ncbi:MAG: recombinase family protein [Desulfobacterales bacterium]|nr:recombinase family protein [Desulfobacterales bacterium]